MEMFCYQCEQTNKGTGCVKSSTCGKDPQTAAAQDLLIHVATGISQYCHQARQHGATSSELDSFVVEALFTTVTNVSFDAARIMAMVRHGAELQEQARSLYRAAAADAGSPAEDLAGAAGWQPAVTDQALLEQASLVSIMPRLDRHGSDVTGLQELVMYGVKGTAAYYHHAVQLGRHDDSVPAFFHEALSFLADDPTDIDALTAMALRVGEVNLQVMALLDDAHTATYGHPEPTEVLVTAKKGKAILVSGHDLKDLDALLEQTEGTGINVYTHGEMLPALAYPKLKRFPHLVGNYGGAWQDQQQEFAAFPGAVLMTTNCIIRPLDSYQGRIFTCGLVAWPGVRHITGRDFSPVIEAAQAAPGFAQDEPAQTITIGFARNAVLGVAETVIEAVKAGKIRHFFLIGGCDGARSGRNYYTELAEQVPDDCVMLTLACGKYRFNKLEHGDIGGIPRLLDMGQCNDTYSAIQVAAALAEAFSCEVNELPLSLVLSWFEQKAVCILLTLLHLGILNIRIGPSLPAFLGPNVLAVLNERFNLQPITTPEQDLAAMLA